MARSLALAGVHVVALSDANSPVRRSRFCGAFYDLGGPADVQEHWLSWLLTKGPSGAVLLACSDEALELFTRERGRLESRGYRLSEATEEVVQVVLDKRRTYEVARRAGIPVPAFEVPENETELEGVAASVEYPCVVKPLRGHLFRTRFPRAGKLVVVSDAKGLLRAWAALSAAGVEAMVTEIVPGADDAFFVYHAYWDEHASPLYEVVERKLRKAPPSFGNGSYRITEWNEDVAHLAGLFLQAVRARGICEVEFKRDERDGTLRLIECNSRFSAANELPRLAGPDPALVSYHRALGHAVPPLGRGRDGVRLWHSGDDVRGFLVLRKRRELTIPSWIASLLHRQHLPVFRWSDPLPALVHPFARARRVARRLVGAGRPPKPSRTSASSP